jgi:regulator of replication initiation timing
MGKNELLTEERNYRLMDFAVDIQDLLKENYILKREVEHLKEKVQTLEETHNKIFENTKNSIADTLHVLIRKTNKDDCTR